MPKSATHVKMSKCIHSLQILSKSESFDETSRKIAIDLKNEIQICDIPIKRSDFDQMENKFETAMNELNDHLMPVRAQGFNNIFCTSSRIVALISFCVFCCGFSYVSVLYCVYSLANLLF
jgi:hypothetical protein